MFDVSGGGTLSTDSPVRRQKRFQSALQKFQRFTGSLWAGTLSLGGVMNEGRCCSARTFLEHACPAISCPGRNLRRPDPGWCRRSIGGRRNWLFPLGYVTVQGCWMLPRSPDSHRQEMFCCKHNGHVGSRNHQRTDCRVGMSLWPLT